MNSQQIRNELSMFKNVFIVPRDCLPSIEKYPAGIVLNTDGKNEPGEHWVSIFIGLDGNPIYFDSFGLPPLHLDIISYLDRIATSFWTYNKLTLQHAESKACGMYCIQFLKDTFNRGSLQHFQSFFSSDLVSNERILYRLRYRK